MLSNVQSVILACVGNCRTDCVTYQAPFTQSRAAQCSRNSATMPAAEKAGETNALPRKNASAAAWENLFTAWLLGSQEEKYADMLAHRDGGVDRRPDH